MLAALALGVGRGVTPAAARAARRGPDRQARPAAAGRRSVWQENSSALIAHDKKIVAGTLHFVAATTIGATTTLTDVTEKELRAAVKAIGIKD